MFFNLNKAAIFAGILGIAILSPSCGEDEPRQPGGSTAVSITLSAETLDVPHNGETYVIEVATTGREWDAMTGDNWITITKSGTASQKGSVNVTVQGNASTKARSGKIDFVSGTVTKSVAVNQQSKPAEPLDPSIEVPEGYALVWHDEFDTDGKLDRTWWTHEVQGPGWVNNELQTYVNESYDGIKVTEITDGRLRINCFKHAGKVYSGRVYANVGEGWRYGIFEARIKLPTGRGTWPAFWMMPANNNFATTPWPLCGEIDIMEEVGYNPEYTSSSIHTQSYNHTIGTQRTAERLTKGAQSEFHVYRLEWTPQSIITYVDGVRLLRFDNDGAGKAETWPFTRAFYPILNLAWGGDWGGAMGVDESCLPATMEIDYVRVFQPIE